MGYDLYSEKFDHSDSDKGYFRWNVWTWAPILTLAISYGWRPRGTIFPPLTNEEIERHSISEEDQLHHEEIMLEWEGSYDGNSGQTVTTADAYNIAAALETALLQIPDEDIKLPDTKERAADIDPSTEVSEEHRRRMQLGSKPALVIQFSGKKNKDYIKKFIKFLKYGCFQIH